MMAEQIGICGVVIIDAVGVEEAVLVSRYEL